VEAKKENLVAGLGQCVAEMVAIRMFNEQKERHCRRCSLREQREQLAIPEVKEKELFIDRPSIISATWPRSWASW